MNDKFLDRLTALLMLLGIGFFMVLLGCYAGYQRWHVARAYDAVMLFVARGVMKPDGLTPATILAPETSLLLPEAAQPGNTLLTYGNDTALELSPTGEELHRWHLSYYDLNPEDNKMGRSFIHIMDARLYPNRDALLLFRDSRNNEGRALARTDAKGRPQWHVLANLHDHMALHEGKIYTLNYTDLDRTGVDKGFLRQFEKSDAVAVYADKDGKQLAQYSIISAFLGTPFEEYLYAYGTGEGARLRATSIRVLGAAQAKAFPDFKPGYLLITIRNFNMIAVINPETRKVVWAMRGIWEKPDDAVFAPDGTLWVLDSEGYYNTQKTNRYRLVQVNPKNHLLLSTRLLPEHKPRIYAPGARLELLENGNMLVSIARAAIAYEITPDDKIAWQHTREDTIYGAQRLPPAEPEKSEKPNGKK